MKYNYQVRKYPGGRKKYRVKAVNLIAAEKEFINKRNPSPGTYEISDGEDYYIFNVRYKTK